MLSDPKKEERYNKQKKSRKPLYTKKYKITFISFVDWPTDQWTKDF